MRVMHGNPEVGPVFDALADTTRRQVVRLLGEGPRRAGELAEASGVAPPAMSKHLRVLLDAGVVSAERRPDDARVRVFRLLPESIDALSGWIDELRAEWDQQLDAFKQHVEKRR